MDEVDVQAVDVFVKKSLAKVQIGCCCASIAGLELAVVDVGGQKDVGLRRLGCHSFILSGFMANKQA